MKSRKRKKHPLPKTPLQFLALSAFALALVALTCTWNYGRHDMPVSHTLLLQPAPDKAIISKANRHMIFIPFAYLITLGGVVGAGMLSFKRRNRRDREDND